MKIRKCREAFIVILALVWCAFPSSVYALPTYNIISIDTLPGYGRNTLTAINDQGQVAGISLDPTFGLSAFSQGFLYSGGVSTGIGFLPGHNTSTAYGINNLGQVVGSSSHTIVSNDGNSSTSTETKSLIYSEGATNTLGTYGSSSYSFAYQINDSGKAVGGGSADGSSQALSFESGAINIIGNFIGSTATAINSSGAMTGYWWNATTQGAFISSNGVTNNIGTLTDFTVSRSLDINNSGWVAGYSSSSSKGNQAFIFDGLDLLGLGYLSNGKSSYARAINDKGQVVGYGDSGLNRNQTAFLYESGAMVSINSLLRPEDAAIYSILNAADINNNGWIVADAYNSITDRREGVLLVPNSVQEPHSMLLMMLGLLALGLFIRITRSTIRT